MKNCPFCSEQIQEDAKKCRFCGEWLLEANINDSGEERTDEANNAPAPIPQQTYTADDPFAPREMSTSMLKTIFFGLAVVMILLATIIPIRLTSTTLPEINQSSTLEDPYFLEKAKDYQARGMIKILNRISSSFALDKDVLAQQNELLAKQQDDDKQRNWYKAEPFRKKAALQVVINSGSRKYITENLQPLSKTFYTQMVEWQEGRKGIKLQPISSPSGAQTDALFALLALLADTGDLKLELVNEFKSQLDQAPAGKWGDIEKAYLALYHLGNELTLDELSAYLSSCQSLAQLINSATLIQNNKNLMNEIVITQSLTPLHLTSQMQNYILTYGASGSRDLFVILKIHHKSYQKFLESETSIRRDWQTKLWSKLGLTGFNRFFWSHTELAHVIRFICLILGCIFFLLASKSQNETTNIWLRVAAATSISIVIMLLLEYDGTKQLPPAQLVIESNTAQSLDETGLESLDELNDSQIAGADGVTIFLVAFFFSLQCLIFIWSRKQLMGIKDSKQSIGVQLRLLENEEQLFDMGLYVGLGGTVLSLLFLSMGQQDQGLVSAYTSTLFGILEVAIFKLAYLRPYKTQLIQSHKEVAIA